MTFMIFSLLFVSSSTFLPMAQGSTGHARSVLCGIFARLRTSFNLDVAVI